MKPPAPDPAHAAGTLRLLAPGDEPTVRAWLAEHLDAHRQWWQDAYGHLPVMPAPDALEREWAELQGADRSAAHLVTVSADLHGHPTGIVQAGVRDDRVMGLRLGVLQWIYVTPARRGHGTADRLMRHALAWMDAQGVQGREVFVTARNAAAVRLYERHGFRTTDHRMLAPAPSSPNP
ncbi:GNAT family N-acetyltransferase [Deinococcus aquiradiocola]|uniref:N-acetyltransferase domain-containing protein n=1 Tax=Deinococcus aquiradiocola TaxID=393059 RepID=A0A917USQ3_9DEIO|nr:GNAT family N-acetyltransferase [Deinococcus aquiradiocola]GGJ82545.1 hypothetical protein GCM10008939_28070 [Deinococcus aquiradiocola]